MKTRQENIRFLQEDAKHIFSELTISHRPIWGQMDAQQMMEHLGLTLKVSNGKIDMPEGDSAERAEKLKRIVLYSTRPLQAEFKNPLVPAVPMPYRFPGIGDARYAMWDELDHFFHFFAGKDGDHRRMHNIFGALNYEEWLMFHYKHFMHHAMQFGLVEKTDKV